MLPLTETFQSLRDGSMEGREKGGGGCRILHSPCPTELKGYMSVRKIRGESLAQGQGKGSPQNHSGSTPKAIITWAGHISPAIFGGARRLQGSERRSSEVCVGK